MKSRKLTPTERLLLSAGMMIAYTLVVVAAIKLPLVWAAPLPLLALMVIVTSDDDLRIYHRRMPVHVMVSFMVMVIVGGRVIWFVANLVFDLMKWLSEQLVGPLSFVAVHWWQSISILIGVFVLIVVATWLLSRPKQ